MALVAPSASARPDGGAARPRAGRPLMRRSRYGAIALLAAALPPQEAWAQRPQPAARAIRAQQAASPRLQLTEVFHVGSLSGRNDAFGRVMDATLDHAGRLL